MRNKLRPPKRIRKEMSSWGPWEDISTRQAIASDIRDLFVGAWRNKVYSVRIYHGEYPAFKGTCFQLSIMRRNAKPGVSWWIKMVIKHQLIGPEYEAIEIYPPSAEIIDPANIYYLICLPKGTSLKMHMLHTEKPRLFTP